MKLYGYKIRKVRTFRGFIEDFIGSVFSILRFLLSLVIPPFFIMPHIVPGFDPLAENSWPVSILCGLITLIFYLVLFYSTEWILARTLTTIYVQEDEDNG